MPDDLQNQMGKWRDEQLLPDRIVSKPPREGYQKTTTIHCFTCCKEVFQKSTLRKDHLGHDVRYVEEDFKDSKEDRPSEKD